MLFEPLKTISPFIRSPTKSGLLRVQGIPAINYSSKTVINWATLNKPGHTITLGILVTDLPTSVLREGRGSITLGLKPKDVSARASPLVCFPWDVSLYWWIFHPEISRSPFNGTVFYILCLWLRLNCQGCIFKIYVILTFADAVHEIRSTIDSLGTKRSQSQREFSSAN